MKKIIIIIALMIIGTGFQAIAQYGFGTNAPNQKAIIDASQVSDKGILIPNVDLNNAPIDTPPEGLMVYNINEGTLTVGFYIYQSGWKKIVLPSDITATNFSGTLPVTKGGTGLSTLGTDGQILRSNGTTLDWKSGFTTRWFYMPAVKLDLTPGSHTINLYTQFTGQFNSPVASSVGATAIPNVPVAATDLYYYVTYNDNSAILNTSISILANGDLTYSVSGTPTSATFMNIVIVIK